jgi:capsular exopolysaccharide synthesis family protein
MSQITEAFARAQAKRAFPSHETDLETPWEFEGPPTSAPTLAVLRRVAAPARQDVPSLGVETAASDPLHAGPGDYEEKLLVSEAFPPSVVEQYRRLGAALHLAQQEHGVRVLMVTSALPGEGKTLVASNLAIVLSESFGRRVLLIDGDLRRPCLHTVFGVENETGLTDRLMAGGQVTPIGLSKTLSLLPAGKAQADPLRILTGAPMQSLLRDSATMYDWVVLDTSPVALLPDARLLAASVDRVLMVIHAGKTPYDAVRKSVELIGRERIVGSVLNRIDAALAAPYGAEYYGLARRRSAGVERGGAPVDR